MALSSLPLSCCYPFSTVRRPFAAPSRSLSPSRLPISRAPVQMISFSWSLSKSGGSISPRATSFDGAVAAANESTEEHVSSSEKRIPDDDTTEGNDQNHKDKDAASEQDDTEMIQIYEVDKPTPTNWRRGLTLSNDWYNILLPFYDKAYSKSDPGMKLFRRKQKEVQSFCTIVLMKDFQNDPFFTQAEMCWMLKHPNCILPVRHQGCTYGCYAYASSGVIYADLVLNWQGNPIEPSTQQTLDHLHKMYPLPSDVDLSKLVRVKGIPSNAFTYVTDLSKLIRGKGIPNSLSHAFTYAKEHGLCSVKDYPSVKCCNNKFKPPKRDTKIFIKQFKVIEAEDIVKELEKKPLAINILIGPEFEKWYHKDEVYYGDKCDYKEKVLHSMMVVGHGKDYYICQNSYGKDFGHKGYIKVSKLLVHYARTVTGTHVRSDSDVNGLLLNEN